MNKESDTAYRKSVRWWTLAAWFLVGVFARMMVESHSRESEDPPLPIAVRIEIQEDGDGKLDIILIGKDEKRWRYRDNLWRME